ncbi:MAG: peptidase U32 family protein [Candidatus Rifleibacteriota bacterium]
MTKSLRKPELMAPAGDFTSLRAAIDAGANAVYFGVVSMNMRASARNFEPEQMAEIASICHEKGVKAYLALNTIIFDREIEKADELVKLAKESGIDAVICWDFAILQSALKHNIEPFVSTQMSVANSSSMEFFYKSFGVKRFVLARECSLEEMRSIRENLRKKMGDEAEKIEIEVFAHGAMCVSVSGRCFMSQFHFGNSANRGECRQPCRREFTITDVRDGKSYKIGKDYVMSPKDLCSLPFLEQILETGVDSLKIEGRGRSPEYVSVVTRAYRKFIDYYFDRHNDEDFAVGLSALKKELMKELDMVFHRGFSDGFYFGRQIEEWTGGNGSKASHRKVHVGVVTNFYAKPMVVEIKVEGRSIKIGDELLIIGPTTGVLREKVESMEQDHVAVTEVHRNSMVGIKISRKAREKDQVYMMVPVDELENVKQ